MEISVNDIGKKFTNFVTHNCDGNCNDWILVDLSADSTALVLENLKFVVWFGFLGV